MTAPRPLARVALGAAGLAAGLVATLASLAVLAAPRASADMSGGLLPVPSQTIARGDRITEDRLTERHFYFDPDRPLSVLTDPREAVGREARRTLAAGKPIPLDAVRTLAVVRRGRPTEARYRVGGLTITTTVLPQADAATGEFIRARNIDSGRTITGVVAEDGAIEVPTQ